MSDSTKPDRTGEVQLDMLGRPWPAKLTFRVIRNLERDLNTSVQALAQRLVDRDLRYEDFATVFHYAIRGGGAAIKDAPSVDEIGEHLLSKRIEHWIVDYGNLVVGVVTAGQAKRVELDKATTPGEARPQTETATSGAATGHQPSATSASTQGAPGT